MPDERVLVRYNLPRALVDQIGDLAQRRRTRHSAIVEALLSAAVDRLNAGADVLIPAVAVRARSAEAPADADRTDPAALTDAAEAL